MRKFSPFALHTNNDNKKLSCLNRSSDCKVRNENILKVNHRKSVLPIKSKVPSFGYKSAGKVTDRRQRRSLATRKAT